MGEEKGRAGGAARGTQPAKARVKDALNNVHVGFSKNLASGDTTSFTPPSVMGCFLIHPRSAAATLSCFGFYVGAALYSYLMGSNTELLTGALPSPTAGTSGKLCISVDAEGMFYVRNRTAVTRNTVMMCW